MGEDEVWRELVGVIGESEAVVVVAVAGESVNVFNLFRISSLGFSWLFTFFLASELDDDVEQEEEADENEADDW